jgi:hypothetical protein
MSNWPITVARRTETLGTGSGTGTTVTAGSANVKGSYATIGTANFQYSGFILNLSRPSSGTQYRIDIAINTGGSDQIIAEDVWFESVSSSPAGGCAILDFPVAIPAGATVKARCQSVTASATIAVALVGYTGDAALSPGHKAVRSCTDWTNTAPSNSVTETNTSFTAWTTICSSLPARISYLWLAPTAAGDSTRTSTAFLAEFGIGSAGAEVAIGQAALAQSTAVVGGAIPSFIALPCDIQAGKRLAFRVQCAGSAADAISFAAMGLAA